MTTQESRKRFAIKMPNGKVICRQKMTDTFRDFVMGMGWESVRDMNFDVNGRPLISKAKPNGWYKELVPGWYVYTEMKANVMRMMAYQIANRFGKNLISVSWF